MQHLEMNIPAPLSLSELKRALAERGLRLTRKRGQNFCVDTNAARAVVTDSGVGAGDAVLEVGPGAGHLTIPLLAAGARVLAVELDRGLFEFLSEFLEPSELPLKLLHADILKGKHELNPEVVAALADFTDGFHVVSNLPYSVATPFLVELVLSDLPWKGATVTVQAELADRLSAAPGGKSYGAASVIIQTFAKVKKVRALPPDVFWPRPDVGSAVLSITPVSDAAIPMESRRRFAEMMRVMFSTRRKKLSRALAAMKCEDIQAVLADLDIDADARPEAVDPVRYAALFRALS